MNSTSQIIFLSRESINFHYYHNLCVMHYLFPYLVITVSLLRIYYYCYYYFFQILPWRQIRRIRSNFAIITKGLKNLHKNSPWEPLQHVSKQDASCGPHCPRSNYMERGVLLMAVLVPQEIYRTEMEEVCYK